jgi:hypothetical protein
VRQGLFYDHHENQEIPVPDCDLMWSRQVGVNFIRLARQHPNIGHLQNPSGTGKAVGECGDSVEVFLQVDGGSMGEAIADYYKNISDHNDKSDREPSG